MPRFAHKRVGYLAANQCFTEDTEVVLLCTNHLQKEFKSQNPVCTILVMVVMGGGGNSRGVISCVHLQARGGGWGGRVLVVMTVVVVVVGPYI